MDDNVMAFGMNNRAARLDVQTAGGLQKIPGIGAGMQRAAIEIERAIATGVLNLSCEQITAIQIDRSGGARPAG